MQLLKHQRISLNSVSEHLTCLRPVKIFVYMEKTYLQVFMITYTFKKTYIFLLFTH